MAKERWKERRYQDINIEVVGSGTVGDKAGQLIEKTAMLNQVGFLTPRRVVLANDFFEDQWKNDGQGNLGEEQKTKVAEVAASFRDAPLAVRSSAQGDARGTGIYKSIFAPNQKEAVEQAVREVFSSYFSQDAIAFRRDAKTGEGMGVMIEPIVGQRWEMYLAPIISGYGYTSTPRGEGYISIVPGLGGGVKSRMGEIITETSLNEFEGNLMKYISSTCLDMLDGYRQMRNSYLLGTERIRFFKSFGRFDGMAYQFSPDRKSGEVCSSYLNFDESDDFETLNLLPTFDRLSKVEQKIGRPQYLEWALTVKDRKSDDWLLQIANVDKKVDVLDFGDYVPWLTSHSVTGSGIRGCQDIVQCWNFDEIPSLQEYNKNHKNYILIYLSSLIKGGEDRINNLKYYDLSNAGVVLELQDSFHRGNPISHWNGQMEMTDKYFGVIDRHKGPKIDWDYLHQKGDRKCGLFVIPGGYRVIASERQNQMIVCEA